MIDDKIAHLGKNPSSGGSPPKERNLKINKKLVLKDMYFISLRL